MSGYSEKTPEVDVNQIDLSNLLPSSTDADVIQRNFAILVSRTLAKYMPYFKAFCRGMERHIQHEFSNESAQKSEVVSLCENCAEVHKLYKY